MMCRVSGISYEDYIGKTARELGFPDYLCNIWDQMNKKVLETSQPQNVEFQYDYKGHKAFYNASTVPEFDERGNITGLFAICRDISDRKNFQYQLQQSRENLRALLDATSDIALLIDTNGSIIIINEEAANRLGGTMQSLVGKCAYDCFDEDTARVRKKINDEVIKTGKSIRFGDQRVGKHFEHSVYPVFDNDNNVTRLAIFSKDVTNFKKAQEEIREFQQKMFRAEQLASLGTLSATMTHELNQPLTVLKLLLQQSQRHLKSEKIDKNQITENINDCLKETENASVILDRFRNFARKSSVSGNDNVNIFRLAKRVINILEEKSAKVGLKLIVEMDSIKNRNFKINLAELEQIFFILIQNSIQACNCPESQLTLKAYQQNDGTFVLTAKDNCSGIKRENIEKIFEPFFTTKPHNLGTGLGLTILERIVTRYNGHVEVESKEGYGTKFTVKMKLRSN
jgi:PAS domain S-box-containing protein